MASTNIHTDSRSLSLEHDGDISPPEYSREDPTQEQSAESAIDGFLFGHARSAEPLGTTPAPKLSKPVVIPQRRPGNKERGFVKAYAPDLDAFGIDQESFLAFIRAVNKAAQASKWLQAIQVAAFGTGFIPNHIALGVSAAVQIIAGIVAKTETRWKTNSFMDRMNDDFFRPRGLYCLIMAYNPTTMPGKETPDPVQAMASHDRSSSSTARGFPSKAKQNLRSPAAGTSQGEAGLPDSVAKLVHPDIVDATVHRDSNSATKKKAFARLNNYFDRRAQARYAAESKGDILSSTPQASFSNRYLDPNHPASNGGLLGLLSGGKLTPDPEKQKEQMRVAMADQAEVVRDMQSAQMANLYAALQGMGLTPQQQRDYIQQYETANALQLQQLEEQSKLLEQGQRRIHRNILYLMIINMPTAAEIEAASRQQPISGYNITNVNVE